MHPFCHRAHMGQTYLGPGMVGAVTTPWDVCVCGHPASRVSAEALVIDGISLTHALDMELEVGEMDGLLLAFCVRSSVKVFPCPPSFTHPRAALAQMSSMRIPTQRQAPTAVQKHQQATVPQNHDYAWMEYGQ